MNADDDFGYDVPESLRRLPASIVPAAHGSPIAFQTMQVQTMHRLRKWVGNCDLAR